MIEKRRFKSLVLSGAVLKGSLFLGCIQKLKDEGMLSSIDTFVGASSGSIVCLLTVLGYDPITALEVCNKELDDYSKKSIDIENILGITTTLGIDDGTDIVEWLSSCVECKLHQPDATFMELAKKTGRNLVICASDVTTSDVKYFSLEDTPDMSVITAVRASIAVPYLFTPVCIDEHIFVDAGLFNNFPIDHMRPSIFKDTLGIEIESKAYKPEKVDILSFTCMMVNGLLTKINTKIENTPSTKSVVIWHFYDEKEGLLSIDPMSFRLKVSESMMQEYFDIGYRFAGEKLLGSIGGDEAH